MMFSGEVQKNILPFILNAVVAYLLISGVVNNNAMMFKILTILSICELFIYGIVLIIVTFGLAFLGATGPIYFFLVFAMSIYVIVTLISINVSYSMYKITRAGGTGWERKNAKEIQAEKALMSNNAPGVPGMYAPHAAPPAVAPGYNPGYVPGYNPGYAPGYNPGVAQGGYNPSAAQGGYNPGVAQGGYNPGVAQGGYNPGVTPGTVPGYAPDTAPGYVGATISANANPEATPDNVPGANPTAVTTHDEHAPE